VDETRIYEIGSKVEKHDEDIKEIKIDIKDLYAKTSLLTELSISIKTLAENLKDVKQTVVDIKKDQDEFKDEVAALKSLPTQSKAKMFDKAVIAVVSAIGGGILMYLLKVVFPQIFS